jgi:hypothetical protein
MLQFFASSTLSCPATFPTVSALQLHQFELAVGQTDCTAGSVTQESGTKSSTPGQPALLESGTAATTTTGTAGAEVPTTMSFDVPAYVTGENPLHELLNAVPQQSLLA